IQRKTRDYLKAQPLVPLECPQVLCIDIEGQQGTSTLLASLIPDFDQTPPNSVALILRMHRDLVQVPRARQLPEVRVSDKPPFDERADKLMLATSFIGGLRR